MEGIPKGGLGVRAKGKRPIQPSPTLFTRARAPAQTPTRACSPTQAQSRQPRRPLQTRPTLLPKETATAVMQRQGFTFTSVTTIIVPKETAAFTLTTKSCASVHWPPVGMRATSKRLPQRKMVARVAAKEIARTVSPRPRPRRKPRPREQGLGEAALHCVSFFAKNGSLGDLPRGQDPGDSEARPRHFCAVQDRREGYIGLAWPDLWRPRP